MFMTQCDRIRLILQETGLKQRQLATELGVTEGYISVLLKKPEVRLSRSVAILIEEKYGYNTEWILSGAEPKLQYASRNRAAPEIYRTALVQLKKLSEEQVKAVLAFIHYLNDIEQSPLDE